jgi:hypothetical protein
LPVPPQLAAQKQLASSISGNSIKPSPRESKSKSNLEASFEIVNARDVSPMPSDRDGIYKRLIKDLTEQIKLAATQAKHFQNMGDIHNAKK